MPVVARPQVADHAAEMLDVTRVHRIGPPLLDRQALLRTNQGAVPVGHVVVRPRAVGGNPQQQGLPPCGRRLQRPVEQVPAILIALRLDEPPVDAEVGQRRVRVVLVLQVVVELLVFDRVPLGPFRPHVELVAVEPLKGHETDARIDQHVANLLRADRDRLLRQCGGRQTEKQQQQSQLPDRHRIPFLRIGGFGLFRGGTAERAARAARERRPATFVVLRLTQRPTRPPWRSSTGLLAAG